MNINAKDLLPKLGWSSYNDGKTWHKGTATMTTADAMNFEITRLVAFHNSFFVCPDCGYKITSAEFIDEQFHALIHKSEAETMEQFYSDGSTKIERHTLQRAGFPDLKLRKIHGKWEMLAHKYASGDERWVQILMPETDIRYQISLYGISEKS